MTLLSKLNRFLRFVRLGMDYGHSDVTLRTHYTSFLYKAILPLQPTHRICVLQQTLDLPRSLIDPTPLSPARLVQQSSHDDTCSILLSQIHSTVQPRSYHLLLASSAFARNLRGTESHSAPKQRYGRQAREHRPELQFTIARIRAAQLEAAAEMRRVHKQARAEVYEEVGRGVVPCAVTLGSSLRIR